MNELIRITANEQGSLAVESLDFAAGLAIQHKNLLETIRTHQEAIEKDFGIIAFETRKVEGRGRPETVALLTEDQALFVGTLSRNSKRVVEFKAVLIKSFAEARKQYEPTPAPALSNEQLILQLMAGQQEILSQLRADVEAIKAGQSHHPPTSRRIAKQLPLPGMPPARPQPTASLRSIIHQHVIEYAGIWNTTTQETYTYLYRRLYDVYGVNSYRLQRVGNESILDALERYGHLDRLYALLKAELIIPDDL
ncbi:Rha family transcriptional regulator [Spirosoma sordidisoli]|nr:Rha family transcriptional regulator [Spirosoma sordidisoli]